MNKKLLALFAIMLMSVMSFATVHDSGTLDVDIPDNATSTYEITVTSTATSLTDLNVGFNITHTYNSDLKLTLSHGGTDVIIMDSVGGSTDNFVNTILDDEATVAIAAGVAPYTGSFIPTAALSAFDGMDINGVWTLTILDQSAADTGILHNWYLVEEQPGTPGVPVNPTPANGLANIAVDFPALTWELGINTATYDLYVGEGSLPTTPVVTGADAAILSYALPQLDDTAFYLWKVVAISDADIRTEGPVWSFTTVAGIVSDFPYMEDFERGDLPLGWSATGDVPWTFQTGGNGGNPATAHSGLFNAYLYEGSTAETSGQLITLPFDLTGYAGGQFGFWLSMIPWVNDIDSLNVYIKAEETDEWGLVRSIASPGVAEWTYFSFDIEEYGSATQIKFDGYGLYGRGICIDDFNLLVWESSPNGIISGTVMDDDNNPVEGAHIVLSNGEELVTDMSGIFMFVDIPNGMYSVDVIATGYDIYMGADFYVGVDDAVTSVPVALVDYAGDVLPPNNVVAYPIGAHDLEVDWNPAGLSADEFRYDDGTVVGQLGFGDNEFAIMGAVHHTSATLTSIQWLLTSNTAHPECKLFLFGLDMDGVPDATAILHESALIANTDDMWNEYILPEEVEAPNGFFVGVLTPNLFTALGLDDGVGYSYNAGPGMNYGIGDYTAEPAAWLDLFDSGFVGSFTIRAYGTEESTLNRNHVATTGDASEITFTNCDAFTPAEVYSANRDFIGYNVYRDDTLLTTNPITNTYYRDAGLANGTYSYTVENIYHEYSAMSDPAQGILGASEGTISGLVIRADTAEVLAGVDIVVTNGPITYSTTTTVDGTYSVSVLPSTYTVQALMADYDAYVGTGVVVGDGENVVHNIDMNLTLVVPANLTALVSPDGENEINLTWDAVTGPVLSYNIYRNDEYIDSIDASTEPTYLDFLTEDGTYVYAVTAVYGDALASAMSEVVTHTMFHPGVDNLNVVQGDNDGTAMVSWDVPGTNAPFTEGFEDFADFSIDLSPFTTVDVDGLLTYGFNGAAFEHSGEAMSFIAFNPASTDPALTDASLMAHSGDKYAACFASVPAAPITANDDYLITPLVPIRAGNVLSFWAKSQTVQYGAERFRVYISFVGTDLADFDQISAGDYIEAPVDWTEFTYDLSGYAGLDAYIAIQCISTDAFIFMLDDLYVGLPTAREYAAANAPVGSVTNIERAVIANASTVPSPSVMPARINAGRVLSGYRIYVDGELIDTVGANVFEYQLTGLATANYTVSVTTLHASGVESAPETAQLTSANDASEMVQVNALMGNYPNPFNPTTAIVFHMKEAANVSIQIYNVLGQKVITLIDENRATGPQTVTWTGTDSSGKSVGSGIYFYKMKTGRYTSTKKMILMK